MEPPKHRLGDVVDDYCTRCRLLMNHAVVGMVEEKVKKVRCQTCLFEHSYRHGRLPKKRDQKGALYKQVLDSIVQERHPGAAKPEETPPAETRNQPEAGAAEGRSPQRRRPRSHSLAAQLGVKKARPAEPVSPSVQRQPQHGKGQSWRPRRDPGGVDPRKWMEPGKLFFGDTGAGQGRDRGQHRDGDRGRPGQGDRGRDAYHGSGGRGHRRQRRHRGGR